MSDPATTKQKIPVEGIVYLEQQIDKCRADVARYQMGGYSSLLRVAEKEHAALGLILAMVINHNAEVGDE